MDVLTILCDIIQHELGLASGQVMVYNQKILAPTTPGTYVVVGYIGGKAIGNVADVTDETVGINETQSVSMLEMIQIDVMSVDSSARLNKEQVIMALHSDYAQKAMELNLIQIARIPGQFNDVSGVEGTAMLNRYTMMINVLAVYTKTKAVDYYDDDSRCVPPTIVANV
jgi:hypothetical protein